MQFVFLAFFQLGTKAVGPRGLSDSCLEFKETRDLVDAVVVL